MADRIRGSAAQIPSPPAERGERGNLPPLRGGRGDLFNPHSVIEAFSFLTDDGKVTPLLPNTAPAQIARLHEVHHRAIATPLREYRLLLRELRPAAKAHALAEAEAFDFPDDQLTDAPRPKSLPDPTKPPETEAELEARMHAELDILEQAALKRFPELAQTD